MKVFRTVVLTFACVGASLVFSEPTATEVIKKGEDQMRGNSAYSKIEIIVEKPRFKRSILLDSYDNRKQDKFFIRILEPKKDKNTTFLKIKSNLWQYIPKIGKEIKIEASLMGDSWMGSDFTNDDLVKENSIVDDFTHSFLESQDPDLYKIVMNPKPYSSVVWAKIIIYSRKKDCLPVKEEFYDEQGRLKKVMILSNFKVMGGKLIPSKMVMGTIENNQVKSRTTLNNLQITFDLNIPDFIFSKANLRTAK